MEWQRSYAASTPHTDTKYGAYACPGGWWKKWGEVRDQVFGTNNEVSGKNRADTVLETSQHTGVYWFFASSREIFIHRRN
jgi:hypothetical protein